MAGGYKYTVSDPYSIVRMSSECVTHVCTHVHVCTLCFFTCFSGCIQTTYFYFISLTFEDGVVEYLGTYVPTIKGCVSIFIPTVVRLRNLHDPLSRPTRASKLYTCPYCVDCLPFCTCASTVILNPFDCSNCSIHQFAH